MPTASRGAATLLDGDLHRQAKPPVSYRILRKAAVAPLHAFEALALEDAKALPQKRSPTPLRFRLAALKGTHPSERRAPRLTRQRSRTRFAAQRFCGILGADALNRVRTDALEVLAGSGGEVTEIKAGEKFGLGAPVAIRRIDARGIGPVENLVDFHGGFVRATRGLGFDFKRSVRVTEAA